MSIDIQKWKAEAHENAAKTVANMLQVSETVLSYKTCRGGNLQHTCTVHVLKGYPDNSFRFMISRQS